jgi:hypothetical protein
MNSVIRWSRAKGPLRAVDPAHSETPAATSIMSTAAAILREELQSLAESNANPLSPALGANALLAGQPAEERLGQLQYLVDALSRLVNLPSGQLMELIGQAPAGIQAGDARASESLGVLQTSRPVAAGDVSRLSLHLENDDAEPDECTLCVTDLIGPSGHRIPASHVRVSPHPANLPGRGSADVQIEVRIPSETPTGCYTGLLQTDDGEALRALVRVRVGR